MISLFNDRLREFIQDISRIYPSSKEFGMAHMVMSQIDPYAPLKMFNEMVREPYAERIRKRDESILFSHDVDDQVNQLQNAPNRLIKEKDAFNILAQIRQLWSTIDCNDREAIWKHLNVLLLITERVIPL